MKIYYKLLGAHIHCRVFFHGKAGDLVFTEKEWPYVMTHFFTGVEFIEE